jgi:hypothetical protein
MHFLHAYAHTARLLVFSWMVMGAGTALVGLAWTCWKSTHVLRETPSENNSR